MNAVWIALLVLLGLVGSIDPRVAAHIEGQREADGLVQVIVEGR